MSVPHAGFDRQPKPDYRGVSAAHPCPVCRKPKRCKVRADGRRALCFRVPSDRPSKGGESWRHDLDGPAAVPPANPPAPPRDWPAAAAARVPAFTEDRRRALAAALNLPADALAGLPLTGSGLDGRGPYWCFPESDAAGTVIGLNRRYADGAKRAMAGGQRGLTLPAGWRARPGPVYVVEGPTDALAVHHAGLACVGRPSNAGGAHTLAALFADLPADRGIVVVGENDKKPDGRWPGQAGADAVAGKLAAALARPVAVAYPPAGAKDVREWLTDPARGDADWPARGAKLARHLDAGAVAVAPAKKPAAAGDAKPAAADVLIGIGRGLELWHDDAGDGYATKGRQSFRIHGSDFARFLTHQYLTHAGKAPPSEAVASAQTTLDAVAVFERPQRSVNVRVARDGDRAYLHLADVNDTVIEIGPGYWKPCDAPPVRFVRPGPMLELPMPVRGGTIDRLRDFINVPDADYFALVVGWLSMTLKADGPFPLLVLEGEQGTAKTTTAKTLKMLIDPSKAPLRSLPGAPTTLMLSAAGAWVLAFDNQSTLSADMSDALCRVATGGGLSVRKLYTDDGEKVFEAKRPAMMNGIDDFISRPDLLERAVVIHHPPIPPCRRRTEAEMAAAFEVSRPTLLGALLERVAQGLAELPEVRLPEWPRMADFMRLGLACERGMDETPRFQSAYDRNQADTRHQALEASPLVEPIRALMRGRAEWRGTASELYDALSRAVPTPPPHGWPKKPNAMMGLLTRVMPDLRRGMGLSVSKERATGGDRPRVVVITQRPA